MGGSQSIPDVSFSRERVVIVTGGNTGIGYETAKWIAMFGARVIIACRSEERATKAIAKMQEEFRSEKEKGTKGICDYESLAVEFMQLNLASLKSVENFIQEFKAKETQLHVLLCNAGIALHEQEYTEDGFEIMFQVNYLGHFLLTSKLLPLMLKSGEDCRVIMVSSEAHLMANFNIEKAQGKEFTKANFPRMAYYGNSKIYQIMQTYSLNRFLVNTNVTVNTIHPGIVDTEISRSFDDLGRWKFFFGVSKLFRVTKTSYEGAKTLINAAVNPAFSKTRDAYYVNMKPTQANSTARNVANQESLWNYSLECLKSYLTEEDMAFLTNAS